MKRTFGFTLIELMIVLAIISILAAIIIPRFSSGSRPIGAHDFSPTNGTVVNETKCSNGLVMQNGNVLVKDGAAVKC